MQQVFKPGVSAKNKHLGRKRGFSSTEQAAWLNPKIQPSSSVHDTKDSSSSSGPKQTSPGARQPRLANGQQDEPKSVYICQLRLRIKETKGEMISISELKDHIVEISKDQLGSRHIQKVYPNSTDEEKQSKAETFIF